MRVRSNRPNLSRLIQSALAAALLIVVSGTSASAEIITVVPESTILRAEVGTRSNLTEIAIEPRFIGRRCRVDVISQNQSSIHNGNDLVITTGSVETVIADVEAEGNLAVDLSTEIVLGETLSVDLRMGPDRISSLGFTLSLECGLQETVQLATASVACTPTDGDSGPCHQAVVPTTTTTTRPPPPVEVATPGPGLVPPICPHQDGGSVNGSMTVDTANCTEAAQTTTTTAPPATVAPPTGDVEVLGAQVNRLPRTAPATAFPKAPNYTG